MGGERCKPGEKGDYLDGRDDVKPGSHSPFYHKPKSLYNSGEAVCGAKGCTRACMIAMEKRGVLKNKFEKPFRRKPLWSVDWSKYTQENCGAEDAEEQKPPREPD